MTVTTTDLTIPYLRRTLDPKDGTLYKRVYLPTRIPTFASGSHVPALEKPDGSVFLESGGVAYLRLTEDGRPLGGDDLMHMHEMKCRYLGGSPYSYHPDNRPTLVAPGPSRFAEGMDEAYRERDAVQETYVISGGHLLRRVGVAYLVSPPFLGMRSPPSYRYAAQAHHSEGNPFAHGYDCHPDPWLLFPATDPESARAFALAMQASLNAILPRRYPGPDEAAAEAITGKRLWRTLDGEAAARLSVSHLPGWPTAAYAERFADQLELFGGPLSERVCAGMARILDRPAVPEAANLLRDVAHGVIDEVGTSEDAESILCDAIALTIRLGSED